MCRQLRFVADRTSIDVHLPIMETLATPLDGPLISAELLSGDFVDRVGRILDKWTDGQFALLGADTRLLLGKSGADRTRADLKLDGETVAFLEIPSTVAMGPVKELIELLLTSNARNQRAPRSHSGAFLSDDHVNAQYGKEGGNSRVATAPAREKSEGSADAPFEKLEAIQRQLYQSEKLASIGQLAAGVAHEVNNPLGFMRSNLNVARGYCAKLAGMEVLLRSEGRAVLESYWDQEDIPHVLADLSALLDESIGGVDRITRVVADLKAFSSVDSAGESMVDVNECIRIVANIVTPRVKEGSTLVRDVAQSVPRIIANAGRLNQMLLNLVLNSLQAIGKEGTVRIGSDFSDGMVRLTVQDDGCGIAEQNLSRIFEPFFTTRSVGRGTGLGLTVALDIARGYGGRIEVHSEPDVGTSVVVLLPAAEQI